MLIGIFLWSSIPPGKCCNLSQNVSLSILVCTLFKVVKRQQAVMHQQMNQAIKHWLREQPVTEFRLQTAIGSKILLQSASPSIFFVKWLANLVSCSTIQLLTLPKATCHDRNSLWILLIPTIRIVRWYVIIGHDHFLMIIF